MDEIACATGTDKSSLGHYYTRIYSKYFDPMRDKPLTFLEIGIYRGNSVKLWEMYFSQADLHFIDIDPNIIEYHSSRSKYHFIDQADRKSLNAFAHSLERGLDIVIDDGGHLMHQQITSFEVLFPYLNPGGIYVIEDLHTSYWREWGGYGEIGNPITGPGTCVYYLKHLIDQLNYTSGVTAIANIEKTPAHIYNGLNIYQKHIETIHFYQSLVFIIKK